jgi:hypothetical protein
LVFAHAGAGHRRAGAEAPQDRPRYRRGGDAGQVPDVLQEQRADDVGAAGGGGQHRRDAGTEPERGPRPDRRRHQRCVRPPLHDDERTPGQYRQHEQHGRHRRPEPGGEAQDQQHLRGGRQHRSRDVELGDPPRHRFQQKRCQHRGE